MRILAGVLTFEAGANFIFRLKKADVSEPTRPWFNTYEATAVTSGSLSDLTEMLGILLAFEASIHYNVVEFQEGSISTWTPDSHPYDPSAFHTIAYSGYHGMKDPSTADVEPREVCWWASRDPQTGNLGKIFYRRALTEAEVKATAGAVQLTNPASKASELAANLASTNMTKYFDGSVALQLTMVSRNLGGYWIRPLTQFSSHGAAIVKFNHKWFNNPRTKTNVPISEWSTEVHNIPADGSAPRYYEYEE